MWRSSQTTSPHERDAQAAPEVPVGKPAGPRLPSRRSTAAIAGAVLLASIGIGAALPGSKADSLAAGAKSPLTAALLGALAAQRAAAGQSSTAAPAQSSPSGSSEPESSAGQEATPSTGTGSAPSKTNGKPSASQETTGQSSETPAEGSTGESSKGEAGTGSSGNGSGSTSTPVPASLLSQITHVWAIVLSSSSFSAALSDEGSAPYLTKQLLPKGTLLSHYALVGASPAANDIALLSGQGPNPETEKGCPSYAALTPGTLDSKGIASGSGCVYPAAVHTLADQTAEAALTWRAYLQDMAPSSGAAATTCRHPSLGGSEPSEALTPGNDYLIARNPFVYFDSLIESQACTKDDVDLSQLSADLANPADTPNLSWIVPGACEDGSKASCGSGSSTGLAGAGAFLAKVVPEITATSAYKQHGLLLITFDSAAKSGKAGSGSQVGALVLSPFVRTGARVTEAFNTYSLLKSLERLFGVPLLGHAADQGVTELDARVYRTTSNTTLVRAAPRQGPSQTGG
jgi:hypothetical protein